MDDAANGTRWPDLWFYGEPDDLNGANDFPGIFLKGGGAREDFKSAWD